MFGRKSEVTPCPPAPIVGEGIFRKCGQGYKSWKVRKYVILSNANLQYYDGNTVKGNMGINSITIRLGAAGNVKASGAPAGAISIDVCSFDDVRNLEVVFDDYQALKTFLQTLAKVSKKHNILAFSQSQCWCDVLPESHESSSALPSSTSPATAPVDTAAGAPSSPVIQGARKSTIVHSPDSMTVLSGGAVPTLAGDIVGAGYFFKLGSKVKSWKERRYILRSNGNLDYYDPTTSAIKGTLELMNNELSFNQGDDDNVTSSNISMHFEPYALDITCANRKFEMVFESASAARRFVRDTLTCCGKSSLVPELFASLGLSELGKTTGNVVTIYSKKTDGLVAGVGNFRKLGSSMKTWKERKYNLTSSGKLKYYELSKKDEKGSIDMSYVLLRHGAWSNVADSGCAVAVGAGAKTIASSTGPCAIDAYSFENVDQFYSGLTTSGRKLELVFDSFDDTKRFLESVTKGCLKHNVQEFCEDFGWTCIISDGTNVRLSNMEDTEIRGSSVVQRKPTGARPLPAIPETSAPRMSPQVATVVGGGFFYKQGSSVKTWKFRKYTVSSDHRLRYWDPNETNDSKWRGELDIKFVLLTMGLKENIEVCGITSDIHEPIALSIKTVENERLFEMVFDTKIQASSFLKYLLLASTTNNVKEFADLHHFELPRDEQPVKQEIEKPAAVSNVTELSLAAIIQILVKNATAKDPTVLFVLGVWVFALLRLLSKPTAVRLLALVYYSVGIFVVLQPPTSKEASELNRIEQSKKML